MPTLRVQNEREENSGKLPVAITDKATSAKWLAGEMTEDFR